MDNYQEIGGNVSHYLKVQDIRSECIEAKYLGMHLSKFDKPNHELEMIADGLIEKATPQGTMQIQLRAGEKVVVNGSGDLNFKMKNVLIGSSVKISYLGKKILEKGKFAGKESHCVSVLADMSRATGGLAVPQNAPTAYQAPAAQPAYQAAPQAPVAQPTYQTPVQPTYQAPAAQPTHQAPATQPAYQAPVAQPAAPVAQPVQAPANLAHAAVQTAPASQPAYQDVSQNIQTTPEQDVAVNNMMNTIMQS